MPLKLVLNSLEYSLDSTRLRVGRAEACDVSIHGDPLVSSHHCVIENALLTDQQSTNGTTVNGQKLKHNSPISLRGGDVVIIGETTLYVVEGKPYDNTVPMVDGKPVVMKEGAGKKAAVKRKPKKGDELPSSSSSSSSSSTSFLYTRPAATVPSSPTNQSSNSFTRASLPPSTRPLPPPSDILDLDSSRALDLSADLDSSQNLLDLSRSLRSSPPPSPHAPDDSNDQLDPSPPPPLDATRIHDGNPLDSPHTQIRRLQAALRESEIKCGRLEKKVAHAQRKSSAMGDVRLQQARLTELEGQNAALTYQILYGDSLKDNEVRQLREELDRAKREGWEGRMKAEGMKSEEGQANGLVQPDMNEWITQSLTPLHEALTVLSSLRSDLLSSIEHFHSQSSSLLSLHQQLTEQQRAMSDSLVAQQKEGEEEGGKWKAVTTALKNFGEGMQKWQQKGNEQREEEREEKIREVKERGKEIAEWRAELSALTARLSDIHRDVSSAASTLSVLQKQRVEEEERKRANDEIVSPALTPVPPPTSVSLSEPPVLHPVVHSHLKSISAQVQQVRYGMFFLLAIAIAILALRRS